MADLNLGVPAAAVGGAGTAPVPARVTAAERLASVDKRIEDERAAVRARARASRVAASTRSLSTLLPFVYMPLQFVSWYHEHVDESGTTRDAILALVRKAEAAGAFGFHFKKATVYIEAMKALTVERAASAAALAAATEVPGDAVAAIDSLRIANSKALAALETAVVAGYGGRELIAAGQAVGDLQEVVKHAHAALSDAAARVVAKCSKADLKAAGYTAAELKAVGQSAADLRFGGFSAADLKAAGYSAAQLRAGGYTAADLRAGGYAATEMIAAGMTPAHLVAVGYTAAHLRTAGCTAAQVASCGCSAYALKDAGYSAAQLSAAGFTGADLRAVGYTASAMRAAGQTTSDLMRLGYEAWELKAGGYTADELERVNALCDSHYKLDCSVCPDAAWKYHFR